MGGNSKGGETKTQVEIPEELRKAAVDNLDMAKTVSSLPLMQNFGGAVAAFTPQQQAGMQSADMAASAFGMPTTGINTGMNIPGMPQAQNFGGVNAYSTQPVYEDAMKRVPKDILQMYEALISAPNMGSPSRRPNGQPRQQPVAAPPPAVPMPRRTGSAQRTGFGTTDWFRRN